MFKPRYFTLQELVHPKIYEARGERAWELLNPGMLKTLDQLREKFGPMVINTWHSPKLIAKFGLRDDSGLRTFDSSEGAPYSAHKFGLAADCIFMSCTAESVRRYVKAHPEEFPFITAIENGVSWFHFDCRNVAPIMEFNP
jgi:hypothetical protein